MLFYVYKFLPKNLRMIFILLYPKKNCKNVCDIFFFSNFAS